MQVTEHAMHLSSRQVRGQFKAHLFWNAVGQIREEKRERPTVKAMVMATLLIKS